jgi:hypothetical protein
MSNKINYPWCVDVRECTEEQFQKILKFRKSVDHSSCMYRKLYSFFFIFGETYIGMRENITSDIFGQPTKNLYTPEEFISLIENPKIMTKVTILGEEKPKELKPIEFCRVLKAGLTIEDSKTKPSFYNEIELVCKNYTPNFDLMFAFKQDRNKGVLYLGHINDRIV